MIKSFDIRNNIDSMMIDRPQSNKTLPEEWNTILQRTSKPAERPDTSIQIAILGNMNVGKTSLTHRYVAPDMPLRVEKITTIGTDTRSTYISLFNETVTKIKIWDTAGQEKHANIVGSYVKRLDACLMVCDLTKQDSLVSIRKWIHELNNQIEMPVIIVGNKSDLTDRREVSAEQLMQLGIDENVHTFEVSAKTGYNVDNAFACLIYQVLKPLILVAEQIKLDVEAGDQRLQTAAYGSIQDPDLLNSLLSARIQSHGSF